MLTAPTDRLELTDDIRTAIVKLAQGNPGAAVACAEVVKHSDVGLIDLCHADDMGLRGPALWIGYKDFAKQDVATFVDALRSRNKDMVQMIRSEGYFAREFA